MTTDTEVRAFVVAYEKACNHRYDMDAIRAGLEAAAKVQPPAFTGQGDEVDPAYTDGPFYYMPMPVNHDGHGPEMDAAKVAYVQHEVWNGYNLSLGTFPSEAIARWVANRLSISTAGHEVATALETLQRERDEVREALDRANSYLQFVARWAWRESEGLTDEGRLSAIKFYPPIKALAAGEPAPLSLKGKDE